MELMEHQQKHLMRGKEEKDLSHGKDLLKDLANSK